TIVQSVGDRFEALVRAGEAEAGREVLATITAEGGAACLRWPRAVAARCEGLLADDGFEAHFETALELFGDDMAFERARTQLCLGMRRRRAHRRADARTALNDALEYFETAGAEPWAEQARAELRASGAPIVTNANGSLRDLTPQELQVALNVAT